MDSREDKSAAHHRPCYAVYNMPTYELFLTSLTPNSSCGFICCIVSITVATLFSIATLIVHRLTPELDNLQGWIVRSYLTSNIWFMVLFMLWSLLKYLGMTEGVYAFATVNFVTAFFSFHSGVACLLWMNMMSYDIWTEYRGIQGIREADSAILQSMKFTCYFTRVWGTSTLNLIILCACTLFLDMHHAHKFNCYYPQDAAVSIVIIVLAICICSMYFYISTALRIRRNGKETGLEDASAFEQHKKNRDWFNLNLKLFVAMHFPMIFWLTAIIWPYEIFLMLVFVLEAHRGVSMFLIIVSKYEVRRSIRKQFSGLTRELGSCLRYDSKYNEKLDKSSNETDVI